MSQKQECGHIQTLITQASPNFKMLLGTLSISKDCVFRGAECDWEREWVWNLTILGPIMTKMCLDILFNSQPQFLNVYHSGLLWTSELLHWEVKRKGNCWVSGLPSSQGHRTSHPQVSWWWERIRQGCFPPPPTRSPGEALERQNDLNW